MSVKIISRVLDTSAQRGASRLLLVVLADFANDDGVCWPGTAKLSLKINEEERYTRLLITKLLESGELLRIVGGGRGKPTLYGVACGLDDAERAVLQRQMERMARINAKNPVPQYRVSSNTSQQNAKKRDRKAKNPDPPIRDLQIPDLQNRDLLQQRSGFFEPDLNVPHNASESGESRSADSVIHDHDPSCVGDGDGAALAEKLIDRGMGATTAIEIAQKGLDGPTILQSLDNYLEGVPEAERDNVIGRFVLRLRLKPPKRGKPYERRLSGPGPSGDRPDRPGRSDGRQDRERPHGRSSGRARPRPGELAYYEQYLGGTDSSADGE